MLNKSFVYIIYTRNTLRVSLHETAQKYRTNSHLYSHQNCS
jgi:hypothetical protein